MVSASNPSDGIQNVAVWTSLYAGAARPAWPRGVPTIGGSAVPGLAGAGGAGKGGGKGKGSRGGKRPGKEYPRMNVRAGGKHRSLRPHRVMAQLFEEFELEVVDEVDHLCFNIQCINPDHLEVVPRLVNMSRRRVNPVRLQ